MEENGTISFGDYTLASKTKVEGFEFQGDLYKVKTFNEITKLEKNETMQMTLWNDDGIMRMGIQTGGYWCSQEWTQYPVMEISTPHGSLIDADDCHVYRGDYSTYSDYSTAFDMIDNAPTVIEAEGE